MNAAATNPAYSAYLNAKAAYEAAEARNLSDRTLRKYFLAALDAEDALKTATGSWGR